ncbi:MAG: MFS transporter, partial [Synergistales bacterium]|nr:MFS transporter [Synergistales bacterium]
LPYLVLLPVFAKDILQGGPEALGFLMGASGIGALAASVLLALRHSPVGLGKTVAAGLIAFGGCVAAFALSRIFLLSLLLIVPVGFSLVIVLTGCNTLIQTLVDDDKRSRVMSLFVMSLLGVAPLGSLHAGWLASHIGAPAVLALGGSACVLVGLVLRRKLPSLKTYCDTIYRQKGLIGDDA